MNDAELHLLVNHLPVIMPLAGLIVLLGGIIFNASMLKRAAYILFVISALAGVVTYSSGEGAEEIVEELGVDHDLIHEHEESAEGFTPILYILGVLSLVGFWADVKKKSFAPFIAFAAAAVTAVVLYFGAQAAHTGGEIRHPEIRETAE